LPAQSSQRTEIEKDQFVALNENWSIASAKNPSVKRHLTITEGNPVIGIELLPHVDAQYVAGTGELVVERALGRGRVVATAFSLAEPRVKSWPSFQTFFSGALLRRPRREFTRSNEEELAFRWVDDGTSVYDTLIGSTLRMTSRDLGDVGTDGATTDEGSPYLSIGSDKAAELPMAQDGQITQALQELRDQRLKTPPASNRHRPVWC